MTLELDVEKTKSVLKAFSTNDRCLIIGFLGMTAKDKNEIDKVL